MAGASVAYDSGDRGLSLGPPPAYYEPLDIERSGPPSEDQVEGGRCCWLSDSQVSLAGEDLAWTTRTVQEVVTADGLQAAAAFNFVFSPDFQHAIVHHVRVIRNGEARELAAPGAFELMRRERDLERAVYDGRLTAHMLLPDVRVGDIIDTAFTLVGDNPVLKQAFEADVRFQWGVPVAHTRVRILAPKSRRLAVRAWGPAVAFEEVERGELVERTWSARDTQAYRAEPNEPSWWKGFSAVSIADALDWSDVADLFRTGYQEDGPLPPMLEEQAATWEAQALEPKDLAFRALNFVQAELRYHAISIGSGGFRPRPLDEICSTRFGDCKDASRALVALLRRLGFDACPALVNTYMERGLRDEAPGARAFNHCIVRLQLAEQTYWLDPTLAVQAGGLDHFIQARHGWALPLLEGADLEPMGENPAVTIYEAREEWVFGSSSVAPVSVEMRTTFRGSRADDHRRRLANDGEAEFARRFQEIAEAAYGQALVLKPIQLRDRPELNEFETVETYELPRLGEKGNGRFGTADEIVGPNLNLRETAHRTAPIDLGVLRRCVSERLITFPPHVKSEGWKHVYDAAGFVGRSELAIEAYGRGRLTIEIEITKRILEPYEAPAFFEAVRKFRGSNGVSFSLAPPVRARAPLAARRGGGKAAPDGVVRMLVWFAMWMVFIVGSALVHMLNPN